MIRLILVCLAFSGLASAFGLPRRSPLGKRDICGKHLFDLFGRFRFERFVDKIFDQADTNQDGSVDFTETYEMVLLMYVQLNQQAPIPPPPRRTVQQIFRAGDKDRNKRVNRQEFTKVARILGRRAIARLVAYKVVTLIGAPLLAEFTLRTLMHRAWLHDVAVKVVPERFLATLTSVAFWRTALIVLFVASLGNIVLGIVNFLLDLNVRAQENVKQSRKRIASRT